MILSRLIWRTDNIVVTQDVNDVITQLKELQFDMIGNEDITRKNFGRKGLHLNEHGLKKFTGNLTAGIKE